MKKWNLYQCIFSLITLPFSIQRTYIFADQQCKTFQIVKESYHPGVIFVEVLDSTSTQRWNIEVRVFQLKRSRKNFRVTSAWLSCAAVCLLLLKLLHFVHLAAISCSPAWHLVFADIWSLLWCRSSICVWTTKRLASYVQDDVSNSVWPSQGAKCVAEKGTLKRKSTNNKISFWLDRWASNYPHLCILIFILQGGF